MHEGLIGREGGETVVGYENENNFLNKKIASFNQVEKKIGLKVLIVLFVKDLFICMNSCLQVYMCIMHTQFP